MSHYTVGIILEEPGDVNLALEPFNENARVEEYISETKAEIIEKQKKNREEKRPYYEEYITFQDEESYKEAYPRHNLSYVKSYEPLKDMTDEELYQDYIKYYEEHEINEDGDLLSTYNPKSKWDWYQIGGRWSGLLITKEGHSVNEAQIKDIDFEATQFNTRDFRSEEEIRLEYQQDADFRDRLKDRDTDLETFIEELKNSTLTYAMLIDDEWIEPGEMGWFGMSSETDESREEYIKQTREYFKQADPELWLVVVDCHI